MCAGQTDCEVLSNIPECIEDIPIIESNDSDSNNTFYSIVKREVNDNPKRNDRPRQKTNLKIRILTKVGKKLGLWNQNTTRSENIKVRSCLSKLTYITHTFFSSTVITLFHFHTRLRYT